MIKIEPRKEVLSGPYHLTVDELVCNRLGDTFYGKCGTNLHKDYWYINWAGVISLSDPTVFFGKDSTDEQIAHIDRFCDISMREVG